MGDSEADAPSERVTPAIARETIREQFALPLGACRQLEGLMRDAAEPWSGRPLHTPGDGTASADDIVAMEFAKSTKTFAAAIELAEHGFGEQACMLNRSLFEGMAVGHWVHANEGEAARRFNEAYRFARHLSAVLVEHVGWASDDPEIDDALLEDARLGAGELKDAEDKFGKYGEFQWTGHRNLRALVEDIEDQWTSDEAKRQLWQFLDVAHRDNNLMLHSTVQGLSRFLSGYTPDGGRFWVGPSNRLISAALFGAYWNYSNMLTLAMDRFELEGREKVDEMSPRHAAMFVELDPEDVTDVQRNDLCPCGSGVKYKKCHQDQVEAIRRLFPAG